eukprot:Ihof_evm2s133 gene=Ihof_evmTU2s133
MLTTRLITWFAVAMLASADPVFKTGKFCTYSDDQCTQDPQYLLISKTQCTVVVFGKCTKASSIFTNFFDITSYDPVTGHITYQRYSDPACKYKEIAWSHPAPNGPINSCTGPIVSIYGRKLYFKVTPIKTTTTVAPKATTTT